MKNIFRSIFLITILLFSLTGCGHNKEELTPLDKKETAIFDISKANKGLSLKLQEGDLTIQNSPDDKIHMDSRIEVTGELTEKEKNDLLEDLTINIKDKSGISALYIASSKNEMKNIDNLNDKLYEKAKISVNIMLKIPENLINYDLKIGSGNIEIDDIHGAFRIRGDKLNLSMKDILIKDNTDIKVSEGKLEMNVLSLKDTEKVDIKLDKGDIDFIVKSDENYKIFLTDKDGDENIKGKGNAGVQTIINILAKNGDVELIK